MHRNNTLVATSFQLISDFFHVNQGVQCFKHAEQASSRGVLGGGGGGGATGLLNKGGGSNRLPGLVTKQQAVEFPQVLASKDMHNYFKQPHAFKNSRALNVDNLIKTPCI